jgi:hypothetical protein
MLENDYRSALSERLADIDCRVEIPRSMQQIFSARGPCQRNMNERRRFMRFWRPGKVLLEVATTIKGIPRESRFYLVVATNISRDGVAFLHEEQLFPGEVSFAWFPTGRLACRVTRCLRHNSRCFEIGATFEAGPQSREWLLAACEQ